METPDQRSDLDAELYPAMFRVIPFGGLLTGNRPGNQRVYLHGACNADRQLASISHPAGSIVEVQLIACDVTDIGLKSVAQLSMLTDLTIWSTRITDAGVAHLQSLPQLRRLSLHGQQITDAAAAAIAAVPSLNYIDLANTSISDDGLKKLSEVENHRPWLLLDVSHTKVTPAGVESLRKICPQFDVRCTP